MKKKLAEKDDKGGLSTVSCLVKCILIDDRIKRIDCALKCLAGGLIVTERDVLMLKAGLRGGGRVKGKSGGGGPCD